MALSYDNSRKSCKENNISHAHQLCACNLESNPRLPVCDPCGENYACKQVTICSAYVMGHQVAP